MATTGDWRDRWEERDIDDDLVIDVWERDGKAVAYLYQLNDSHVVCDQTFRRLIPKPQPPRPKTYRPYTEAELWDLLTERAGVLWVKRKVDERHVMVTSTGDPDVLHRHFTHLNGSPFGMEVEE